MKLSDVLKKPMVTEKTASLNAQGRYAFEIDRRATKQEVKQALEKFFKVKVIKVQTIDVVGKKRRALKTRKQTSQASWKKAIATLKEGEKIDLFETGA